MAIVLSLLCAAGANPAHAFRLQSIRSQTFDLAQAPPGNLSRPPQRNQPSVIQRLKPTGQREIQPFSGHDRVQQAMRNGEIVSLRTIRQTVRTSYPGRIIDVQLLELNNRNVPYLYVVKVLTEEGRVLDITLNARDAAVLRVQGRKDK